MNFFKYFQELPPLAKTIITIFIIVIIIVLVLWIRNIIKKASDKAKINKDFKSDYDAFIAQGQKPTYPQTNYTLFADKIYEAGCANVFCYGTDEEAIYDVFKQMKNDVDVLLLIKAFGARMPRGSVCIPFTDCPGIGLGEWLQTELSSYNFSEINNILAKNSITFKF